MTDDTSGETCSKGHLWAENTLWESAGRGSGRRRRRCRQCRRDKRMQAAADAAKGFPSSNPGQARRGRGAPERAYSVERALVDFDYALKYISTPCMVRVAEFSDYELEDAPSPATAAKMCEPCVLRDLCQSRATAEPPDWCVWGGEVWVEGEKYMKGTK